MISVCCCLIGVPVCSLFLRSTYRDLLRSASQDLVGASCLDTNLQAIHGPLYSGRTPLAYDAQQLHGEDTGSVSGRGLGGRKSVNTALGMQAEDNQTLTAVTKGTVRVIVLSKAPTRSHITCIPLGSCCPEEACGCKLCSCRHALTACLER